MSVDAGTSTEAAGDPGSSTARVITRLVFNGASTLYRHLANGGTQSSGTVASTPGTATVDSVTWLADHASANLSEATIARHIVFAGVAGNNTAASDEHDVFLRTRYSVAV